MLSAALFIESLKTIIIEESTQSFSNHGTIIQTGITCKKIFLVTRPLTCWKRDSCFWFGFDKLGFPDLSGKVFVVTFEFS